MKQVRILYGNGSANYEGVISVHDPKDYAEVRLAALATIRAAGVQPKWLEVRGMNHLTIHPRQAV